MVLPSVLPTTRLAAEDAVQKWIFKTVVEPNLPLVASDSWSRNGVDRFVKRKLEENGMAPAPRAPRSSLIRRLYFDLLGLPPAPEEIAAHKADTSPEAWERLVDRLLGDPRYGEHWARQWLDVVRYSESDGWNQDAYRPHIWRYRQYVIDAFNSDKPYPDFVREQLAGDEIHGHSPEQLAATGFLRLGIYEYNQRDARNHWNDIVNELTDTVGDAFLGMSLACARCHDHKFDPLSQRDYHKWRAFFEPLVWRDDLVAATEEQMAKYEKKLADWKNATQKVRDRIDVLIKPYYDKKWFSTVDKFPLDIQACFHKPVNQRNSWEHQMAYLVSRQFEEEGGGPLKNMEKEDHILHQKLLKELAAFDHLKPPEPPPLMVATDFHGPPSPTVIPGGTEPISPGVPTVLAGECSPLVFPAASKTGTTGRRTSLARWIGSPDNGLTNRVAVNRLWQQHFGVGIVGTANDFGSQGRSATHPELLDWLAARFIQSGWSAKYLHRQILCSATWQQSSAHPHAADYQGRDPEGHLLWRARIRRLQAEQVRDALLRVSGQLDDRLGGPAVDQKAPRRGIYVKSFRNKSNSFMHCFDLAPGLRSLPRRECTTTPTQSLTMINGGYTLGLTRQWAEKLYSLCYEKPMKARPAVLQYAMRSAWGREPTDGEMAEAIAFMGPGCQLEQLEAFCHVLFNSNEFLYVD